MSEDDVSFVEDIISWKELLKLNNGFVKDNSITLEVKIDVGRPNSTDGGSSNYVTKHRRFQCSICFEKLDDQGISITPCGHMFCTDCAKACPICRKALRSNGLRRVYLPA